MLVKFVRGLRAALVLQAVVAATELSGLGSVYARQTNAGAVNFERVAVDDAGLSGDCFGKCRRRNERDKHRDQNDLGVGIASMRLSDLARGTTYMMAFIGIKHLG